jgi:hypothetical protein
MQLLTSYLPGVGVIIMEIFRAIFLTLAVTGYGLLALALLWRLLRKGLPPMHRVKIESAKKGRDRDVLSNS